MLSKNTLPQEQSEYQSHDMPNCFQKTFREHFELWTQFLQFFNALKVTGLQNGCGTRKLSSPIRLTNAILYLRNNIIYLRLYCYHLWGNKEHTSKKKGTKDAIRKLNPLFIVRNEWTVPQTSSRFISNTCKVL